jgi:hypothetical protein
MGYAIVFVRLEAADLDMLFMRIPVAGLERHCPIKGDVHVDAWIE